MMKLSVTSLSGKHPTLFGGLQTVDSSQLASQLRGKTVALVGNAASMRGLAQGRAIDACDVVVRLNRVPGAQPVSHGVRTTWLALSKLPAEQKLREIDPSMILWMTSKMRWRALSLRLRRWRVHYYDDSHWKSLARRLGSRPSTGIMALDLLVHLGGYSKLSIFGFDFFASGSLSGRPPDAVVPHDYVRERQLVDAWIGEGLPIEIVECK
jgi:hypothetical protein